MATAVISNKFTNSNMLTLEVVIQGLTPDIWGMATGGDLILRGNNGNSVEIISINTKMVDSANKSLLFSLGDHGTVSGVYRGMVKLLVGSETDPKKQKFIYGKDEVVFEIIGGYN